VKPPRQARGLSALNAAAQVLAASDGPLSARELVERMADTGLWTSPRGKTPEATLYAGMLREINSQGDSARFQRVGRGRFAARKA
jgi:hypothetical protein